MNPIRIITKRSQGCRKLEPTLDRKPQNAPRRSKRLENAPRKSTRPANAPPKSKRLENAPPKSTQPENAPLKSKRPENAPPKSTQPENAQLEIALIGNAQLESVPPILVSCDIVRLPNRLSQMEPLLEVQSNESVLLKAQPRRLLPIIVLATRILVRFQTQKWIIHVQLGPVEASIKMEIT